MTNDQSVLPRAIGALAQRGPPVVCSSGGMALDLFSPLAYAADHVVAWNAQPRGGQSVTANVPADLVDRKGERHGN